MKNKRCTGAALLALWLSLTLFAWLRRPGEISDAERRKLAQFPKLSQSTVTNGTFMSGFEKYTQDQFPARDTFRQLKAVFHQYILGQKDNHGIYIADGYAAKLEYPLSTADLDRAVGKLNTLYEKYLTNSQVYLAVVPDKDFYLAEENGYPSMDYDLLFQTMADGAPWAEFVDLRDCLSIRDYYRTDTHWRQESLLPAASKLCGAMGAPLPQAADYTTETVLDSFYGVYYGQAALPMEGEPLNILRSPLLDGCTVSNYETGKTGPVYPIEKVTARDPYDVFLSGAAALLTIDNPSAQTDRELIVFRDSFGSSMVPLLVQGYRTVTLIDTRYVAPELLGKLVDFHGQDVLMLYSTLVLNNSGALK